MAYKKRQAVCVGCDQHYQQAYPGKKYCSQECRWRSQQARVNTNCLVCDKPFSYYRCRGNAKYCSRKCYFSVPVSQESRLKRSNPGEKHWNWKGGIMKGRKDRNLAIYKDWRNAVFARDGYTCQFCGIKNAKGLGYTVQLEADHLKSWTLHPELRYEVDNGRTLCKDCHSERTGQQHKERMAHV